MMSIQFVSYWRRLTVARDDGDPTSCCGFPGGARHDVLFCNSTATEDGR